MKSGEGDVDGMPSPKRSLKRSSDVQPSGRRVECTASTSSSSSSRVARPSKKAVYEFVKSLVEWKITDRLDEANNWLLEGRTVLIFKGGDRKDPAKYRPITCLPTITKMVTLAINKRMQRYFFRNNERSIVDFEERRVRSS